MFSRPGAFCSTAYMVPTRPVHLCPTDRKFNSGQTTPCLGSTVRVNADVQHTSQHIPLHFLQLSGHTGQRRGGRGWAVRIRTSRTSRGRGRSGGCTGPGDTSDACGKPELFRHKEVQRPLVKKRRDVGILPSNKKLLGAPGIATRSKHATFGAPGRTRSK